ncbi:signal peptidase complex catalytic subunit SEC11C [Galendromus occidentalis]|uniref:Signal peptidase complex catalytic subunit SEC11 n=1 Tax=Galendromus occidentalis TaxID=34638 RepID=A0AAJ7L3Z7_9ACAR|nr:signal peptidase complex catalytic subunit SEC11C [Galendromus occidentalis]
MMWTSNDLKGLSPRQIAYRVLNFSVVIASALMAWEAYRILTNCESPIVVVLSGSMEPAFQRGDLLLLTNHEEDPVNAGDIVVFKIAGRVVPIVHRVMKIHQNGNGTLKILTKGDNNSVNDRSLYSPGTAWLDRKNIVGRVRGFVPYVGWLSLGLQESPRLKYSILGILGLTALIRP